MGTFSGLGKRRSFELYRSYLQFLRRQSPASSPLSYDTVMASRVEVTSVSAGSLRRLTVAPSGLKIV